VKHRLDEELPGERQANDEDEDGQDAGNPPHSRLTTPSQG
jgi:hypothetical protein